MRLRFVILFSIVAVGGFGQSVSEDSVVHHWGYELEGQAGRIMILDNYQKSYMRGKSDYSMAFKFNHVSLPNDSDAYAHDYHYPTFGVMLKYSKNDGATMHRDVDFPHFEGIPEDDILNHYLADYESRLGNSFAVVGSFSIPFLRNRKWEVAVSGNLGLAYSSKKYDKETNVDNDMIGSHLLFYAGGGVNATYRFARDWGLKAGLDYWHISDGSSRMPNRSANVIGPTLGVVYYPYYETLLASRNDYRPDFFLRYWYVNLRAGVGMKTCFEDWENAQYGVDYSDPKFRTEDFTLYSVASIQADMMYRYARIAAVGGGIDIQYGANYAHLRDLDESKGIQCKHSPWSISLMANHTFFYGNISLVTGFGFYLYREMGDYASRKELPFYNRIGVHYTIPKLHNLTAGIEVKAHLANADFTEFVLSWPIKL